MAETLSTICVNTFIALWLLASLPAGFLADYCLGNYCTQALSMIVATVSVWLVLFSSWQYSVTKPSCCAVNQTNLSTTLSLLSHSDNHTMHKLVGGMHFVGEEVTGAMNHGNCSELAFHVIFPDANVGLPPSLLMGLCLFGLAVREYAQLLSTIIRCRVLIRTFQ